MKKPWRRYLSARMILLLGILEALFAAFILYLIFSGVASLAPIGIAVVSVLFVSQLLFVHFWIWRPYQKTERMLRLFAGGYTLEGMQDLNEMPSPATEMALDRVHQIVSTEKAISDSKRQAQYLALQNQINPHFLYNTLEGIRSDALEGGLITVSDMTEALSTFFRYTISNVEKFVTLEEEIANVENYFSIQKYRFGDRLQFQVCFEDTNDKEELLRAKLPKLTLQPIVENAIIHGIEGKIDQGHVFLRILATENRLIIKVTDDGMGMDENAVHELRERLQTVMYDYILPEGSKKGGIALVNVNNRIRLLFGEAYGITVYSTQGYGTEVHVTLPRKQNEKEEVE